MQDPGAQSPLSHQFASGLQQPQELWQLVTFSILLASSNFFSRGLAIRLRFRGPAILMAKSPLCAHVNPSTAAPSIPSRCWAPWGSNVSLGILQRQASRQLPPTRNTQPHGLPPLVSYRPPPCNSQQPWSLLGPPRKGSYFGT